MTQRPGERFRTLFWNEHSTRRARLLWVLLAVILACLAFIRPTENSVTFRYSNATYHWWTKQALYAEGEHLFLYFPQAVHLYLPFAWQEWPDDREEFNKRPFLETLRTHFRLRAGEALYRICAVALFAWAVYLLSGLISGRDGPDNSYLVVSLLTLPATVAAAAQGHFNMLLAASIMLTAVSIAREKWGYATFWLIAGVMIKPLGLVPLLLFGALYPPLWHRLPFGIAVFLLIGFAHYDLSYAAEQWSACIEKLRVATIPPEGGSEDLSSLFRVIGVDPGAGIWFLIRTAFAPLILGLALVLRRRSDPWIGPILVAAATTTYLMLFNPRNESLSYPILAPHVAALAAGFFRANLAIPLAWFCVLLCVGWGSQNYGQIHEITQLWWKPSLALLFLGLLTVWALNRNAPVWHLKPSLSPSPA